MKRDTRAWVWRWVVVTLAMAMVGCWPKTLDTSSLDNINAAVGRNPILVTALNPVIGYELGAAIAKKAYAEGRPLKDVAQEMTELTNEELDRLLDPAALTEGGIKN